MDEDGTASETTVEEDDSVVETTVTATESDASTHPTADSLEEARERYLDDDPSYDERAYDRDLERLASGTGDLDQLVGDDATGTVWAALAGQDSGQDEASTGDGATENQTETTSLARVGLVSSAALLWSLQTVFVPAALCVFVYALTFSVALGVTVGLLWLVGSVVFSVSLALTLAGEASVPWLDESPRPT